MVANQRIEVGHNVQFVVDEKHRQTNAFVSIIYLRSVYLMPIIACGDIENIYTNCLR